MLKRTILGGLSVGLVALAVVPLLIDQPFGSQTARTLGVAYRLRQWSPVATLVGAAAVMFAAGREWRGSSRPGRAALSIVVALALASAWIARQNPFEWMFNPLPAATFTGALQAEFMQPGDLVLAVTVGRDAAAYPIRQLAYHHVVNDSIGGVPAVVTY